jgi:hypothetical protein
MRNWNFFGKVIAIASVAAIPAFAAGCAGAESDVGNAQAAIESPTTGQPGAPNNTCGTDNPVTPGNSANAPGSAFNGNGTAGTVYAGNPGTASTANSNSTATVSQYDSACVHLLH